MEDSRRTVMLTLTVLLEVPATEPEGDLGVAEKIAFKLEGAIEVTLGDPPNHLGWVSTRFSDIDRPGVNSGRCAECGAWATDCEKPRPVDGLNNGAMFDGRLLCDERLPPGHRWAL